MALTKQEGYEALWDWFGLSRASWITLPRVLCHEMPDEWQAKMATLLEEFVAAWEVDIDIQVRAAKDGRLIPMPEWLAQYRHPDYEAIAAARAQAARRGP